MDVSAVTTVSAMTTVTLHPVMMGMRVVSRVLVAVRSLGMVSVLML